MFRRLSFIGLLVAIGAALALPLPTLAASQYQVIVKVNHCQYSGGAHGHGYVELKVQAREVGVSGTNYFVVLSAHQESSGVSWATQSTWPKETSTNFPNDSTNYYHVTDRRYDFTKLDEISNRLVITVKFKSNSLGVLATRTVKGQGC